MSTLRVTILGCGSSGGVPRATGDWGKCDPHEPKNQRTRCGLLLQQWRGAPGAAEDATCVLIDTPPELRQQLARAKPHHLDAVIFSHDHADQIHGIDDVRAFYLRTRQPIPAFMDATTREALEERFLYCFKGKGGGYPPILPPAATLKPYESFRIDGPGGEIDLTPLDQDHGFNARSLGFRVGPLGYSNDVVAFPKQSLRAMHGLDLWIVDALRESPAPSHAHLALALRWIEDLKPTRAVLTNLSHDLDYQTLKSALPPGVEPAYDGLSVDLEP